MHHHLGHHHLGAVYFVRQLIKAEREDEECKRCQTVSLWPHFQQDCRLERTIEGVGGREAGEIWKWRSAVAKGEVLVVSRAEEVATRDKVILFTSLFGLVIDSPLS